MFRRIGLTLALSMFVAGAAPAHGTSEPGPHGGEIRMPSAFHVEAVSGSEALTVYVLDMQFANPTTDSATVEAEVQTGEHLVTLDCRAQREAFRCPLPGDVDLEQGTLRITATRGDLPPATAEYELPLMQG